MAGHGAEPRAELLWDRGMMRTQQHPTPAHLLLSTKAAPLPGQALGWVQIPGSGTLPEAR